MHTHTYTNIYTYVCIEQLNIYKNEVNSSIKVPCRIPIPRLLNATLNAVSCSWSHGSLGCSAKWLNGGASDTAAKQLASCRNVCPHGWLFGARYLLCGSAEHATHIHTHTYVHTLNTQLHSNGVYVKYIHALA